MKELCDRILEQIGEYIQKSENLSKQLLCLMKMTCFSYELQQLPTSLLAGSIILLALKQGLMGSHKVSIQALEQMIADFTEQSLHSLNTIACSVLDMARNFESDYASTRNLKLVYADTLKTIKFFGNSALSPKQSLVLPSILQ